MVRSMALPRLALLGLFGLVLLGLIAVVAMPDGVFRGLLGTAATDRVRPGAVVSFTSHNYPAYYFAQNDDTLGYIRTNDNSLMFKGDASWIVRPGLADASLVSLE